VGYATINVSFWLGRHHDRLVVQLVVPHSLCCLRIVVHLLVHSCCTSSTMFVSRWRHVSYQRHSCHTFIFDQVVLTTACTSVRSASLSSSILCRRLLQIFTGVFAFPFMIHDQTCSDLESSAHMKCVLLQLSKLNHCCSIHCKLLHTQSVSSYPIVGPYNNLLSCCRSLLQSYGDCIQYNPCVCFW